MKKAFWPALVASAALIGCAPVTPSIAATTTAKPTKTCSNADTTCQLNITVTACTPDGISIDNDVLGILKGSRNINIDWVIKTPGYAFQANGIAFKTDGWQKEFDQPKANKNTFRWRDMNPGGTAARAFSYGITITKADGSACATKDPTIVNDI